MTTIEVRRNNGQCDYGPWVAIGSKDVPQWVAEIATEKTVETDDDCGKIEQGGSRWSWRRS